MSTSSKQEEIRVLLVDDESTFLEQAKIFLKKQNKSIQVETATSPKKALKVLERNHYDCIVSDYQMPEVDGLEFLEVVREDRFSDIPFIMFTGKGREEVAIEALNLGADRYIQKGGNPKSQYQVLTQAIKQETEHKKAQVEMRKSEKKYRKLVETTGDIIVTHDEDGNINFINQAGLDFAGYTEKEVKNKNIKDFIPEDEISALIERKKKRIEEGNRESFKYETVFINKDGDRKDVSIETTPLFGEGEFRGELVVARDITKRKKTEKKLKESEKRFNSLLSNTPAVIYSYEIINGTPKTTFVSESVKDVLGHDPEYYTSDPENFLNDLHPEDAEKLFEREDKLLTDEDTDRITSEYRFKNKQGEYRWLHDEQQLNTYEDGTREVIGAWWDITKRKEAEEREEFLGSLLRHDVRNKIQLILGYKELLSDMDLPEKAQEYILRGKKGVEEALKIIEKVSTLKEAQEEEITEVKIEKSINEVINQIKPMAEEKKLEIKTKFSQEQTEVKAGNLLDRVFFNVIVNSIQHSQGSKIQIHKEETEKKVIIIIEDDGIGISNDKKEKIFDKGFTTDEERGTGLGLFLVKTLVDIYEGNIEIKDSELGGTRFDIYLKKA